MPGSFPCVKQPLSDLGFLEVAVKFLPGGGRDAGQEFEWAGQGEESCAVKQAEDGSIK